MITVEEIVKRVTEMEEDFFEDEIPIAVAQAYYNKHKNLPKNPTRLQVLNYHKVRMILEKDYAKEIACNSKGHKHLPTAEYLLNVALSDQDLQEILDIAQKYNNEREKESKNSKDSELQKAETIFKKYKKNYTKGNLPITAEDHKHLLLIDRYLKFLNVAIQLEKDNMETLPVITDKVEEEAKKKAAEAATKEDAEKIIKEANKEVERINNKWKPRNLEPLRIINKNLEEVKKKAANVKLKDGTRGIDVLFYLLILPYFKKGKLCENKVKELHDNKIKELLQQIEEIEPFHIETRSSFYDKNTAEEAIKMAILHGRLIGKGGKYLEGNERNKFLNSTFDENTKLGFRGGSARLYYEGDKNIGVEIDLMGNRSLRDSHTNAVMVIFSTKEPHGMPYVLASKNNRDNSEERVKHKYSNFSVDEDNDSSDSDDPDDPKTPNDNVLPAGNHHFQEDLVHSFDMQSDEQEILPDDQEDGVHTSTHHYVFDQEEGSFQWQNLAGLSKKEKILARISEIRNQRLAFIAGHTASSSINITPNVLMHSTVENNSKKQAILDRVRAIKSQRRDQDEQKQGPIRQISTPSSKANILKNVIPWQEKIRQQNVVPWQEETRQQVRTQKQSYQQQQIPHPQRQSLQKKIISLEEIRKHTAIHNSETKSNVIDDFSKVSLETIPSKIQTHPRELTSNADSIYRTKSNPLLFSNIHQPLSSQREKQQKLPQQRSPQAHQPQRKILPTANRPVTPVGGLKSTNQQTQKRIVISQPKTAIPQQKRTPQERYVPSKLQPEKTRMRLQLKVPSGSKATLTSNVTSICIPKSKALLFSKNPTLPQGKQQKAEKLPSSTQNRVGAGKGGVAKPIQPSKQQQSATLQQQKRDSQQKIQAKSTLDACQKANMGNQAKKVQTVKTSASQVKPTAVGLFKSKPTQPRQAQGGQQRVVQISRAGGPTQQTRSLIASRHQQQRSQASRQSVQPPPAVKKST